MTFIGQNLGRLLEATTEQRMETIRSSWAGWKRTTQEIPRHLFPKTTTHCRVTVSSFLLFPQIAMFSTCLLFIWISRFPTQTVFLEMERNAQYFHIPHSMLVFASHILNDEKKINENMQSNRKYLGEKKTNCTVKKYAKQNIIFREKGLHVNIQTNVENFKIISHFTYSNFFVFFVHFVESSFTYTPSLYYENS